MVGDYYRYIAENAKDRGAINFDYNNNAPKEARDLVKDKIARQLWQERYGATGGTGPQGRKLGRRESVAGPSSAP